MSTQARLDEITAQIATLVAERKVIAKDVGADIIRDKFAPLFDFPGIDSVSWRQYTPFFNDGEPCEFSVYSTLGFNGGDDDTDEDNDPLMVTSVWCVTSALSNEVMVNPYLPGGYAYRGGMQQWEIGTQNRRATEYAQYIQDTADRGNALRAAGWDKAKADAFGKVVESVESYLERSEDFLLDVFGDHVKVIVTPDGVEVEDYEHD